MGEGTGENCGASGRNEGGSTPGTCGGVPAGKRRAGGGGRSVGLGLGFVAMGVDEGGVADWGSGSGADSEGWGLRGRVILVMLEICSYKIGRAHV